MQRLRAFVAALTVVALVATGPASAFGVITSRIQSVSFVDASHGFMSGGYFTPSDVRTGFISSTSDGGATWQANTFANRWVYGVDAFSATNAWGVSYSPNSLYKTINGGTLWSELAEGDTRLPVTARPYDIAQLSSTVGVVVGWQEPTDNGRLASIWRTADGGATWTQVQRGPTYPEQGQYSEIPETVANLYSVDAVPGGSTLWAVGTEAEPSPVPIPSVGYPRQLIYKSSDSGSSWTTQTAPAILNGSTGLNYSLEGVSAVSNSVAWAVAGKKVIRTTDGGSTWTLPISEIPKDYSQTNMGVSTIDMNAIASTSATHTIVVGQNGKVCRTVNGGATAADWKYWTAPSKLSLQSVAILSDTKAIAVGDDQVVVTLTLNADGSMTGTQAFATNGAIGAPVPSDTTAPSVSAVMTEPSIDTAEVTITASDAGSGVRHIWYRLGSGSVTTVDGDSAVFSVSQLGNSTLYYGARDRAGNESPTKSLALSLQRASTITFAAPTVSSYASAKITGYLKDSLGNGIVGRNVSIQHYYSGAWRTLGTATTTTGGYYTYTAKPTKKTSYRAVFSGDTSYLAVTSAGQVVLPKVYLSTPSASSTMSYGRTYATAGYLKPRHSSGSKPVRIQAYRYQSGEWVLRKTYYAKASNYSSYSKYTTSFRLPYKGRWRIRAYHPACSLNAATYTSYRYTTVK